MKPTFSIEPSMNFLQSFCFRDFSPTAHPEIYAEAAQDRALQSGPTIYAPSTPYIPSHVPLGIHKIVRG
jgi:hypothetical protein